MFITRGELGPENLGELKILAKYRQGEISNLPDRQSIQREENASQSSLSCGETKVESR